MKEKGCTLHLVPQRSRELLSILKATHAVYAAPAAMTSHMSGCLPALSGMYRKSGKDCFSLRSLFWPECFFAAKLIHGNLLLKVMVLKSVLLDDDYLLRMKF